MIDAAWNKMRLIEQCQRGNRPIARNEIDCGVGVPGNYRERISRNHSQQLMKIIELAYRARGVRDDGTEPEDRCRNIDRKSTRLNSSHQIISYAVFCLKKK